jgi:hypothetical protein
METGGAKQLLGRFVWARDVIISAARGEGAPMLGLLFRLRRAVGTICDVDCGRRAAAAAPLRVEPTR